MPAVMRIPAAILCVCVLAGSLVASADEKGITVSGVRYFSYPGFTRVVLEIEAAAPYVLTRSGDGRTLSFSAYGGPLVVAPVQLPAVQDGVVKQIEARQDGERKSIAIVLAPAAGDFKDFVLRGPDRIVIDIQRAGAAPVVAEGALPVIVLDPGHGGTQSGITSGRDVEKAVTLEIAQAVRKILQKSPVKMKVLLTRESDQGLTLDERAAAANGAEASLFVSLHLGQEAAPAHVFILDPDEGHAVAAGAGPSDFLGFDAVNEQQQALWGTQQARHAPESGRLGRIIIRSLSGRETGEPEQAPLALLKSVDAPAVLVETGAGQDRGKTAERIAQGIELYVQGKR